MSQDDSKADTSAAAVLATVAAAAASQPMGDDAPTEANEPDTPKEAVTEAEGENEEVDTANKKTKKKIPKVISDAVRSAQARKANSKGLGKAGVSKRHQRQMALKKDVIMGITNPALSRLARRGGVKRISQGVYDFARETIQNDLRVTLQVAATYANHARRKTITSMDVLYSLKKRGREIYGCGVIAW